MLEVWKRVFGKPWHKHSSMPGEENNMPGEENNMKQFCATKLRRHSNKHQMLH
jgi:hypothetical protein